MKDSLTAMISQRVFEKSNFILALVTRDQGYVATRKFYLLLLVSFTSVFFDLSAVVAIPAPQKIAQQSAFNRPTLKLGSQGERVTELQATLRLLGFYSGPIDGKYNEATANAVSRFKQAAGLNPDGVVDAATWQKLFPNQGTNISNNTQGNSTPVTSSGFNSGFPVPTQPINNPTSQPTRVTTPKPVNTRTNTTKPEPRPTTPKPNQVVNTTKPTNNSRTNTTTRTQTTPRLSPTPPAQRLANIQYTSEGWPILRVGMRNEEVSKLQQRLSQLGFLKGGVDGYFGVQTEEAVKAAQRRYGLEPDGVSGGATWEALVRRSSQ